LVRVEDSMSDHCPAIKLADGTVIHCPLERMRTSIRTDGSYQRWDMAAVAHDNTLTEADVRVANRSTARMSPAVVAGIMDRHDRIDEALASIPAGSSLMDEDGSVPWEALGQLFEAFDDVPAVGLARMTKVMHRKRPALIPILDSVIEAYLVRTGGPVAGTRPERGVALTRVYKREMDSNAEALRCLRRELAQESLDLTECRLLDVFMWSHAAGTNPSTSKRRPRPVGNL
jgi:hypothetical protein